MIIQNKTVPERSAALDEAIDVLNQYRSVKRWTCEVCGMLHTGNKPGVCDSCGADALVPYTEQRTEIGRRW